MGVVLLLGPTASGKTSLAMAVQDHMGGSHRVQLISMDSALVYRGMDIGSAKPTKQELAHYPHRLIDIRDPAEPYTAADFVTDADEAVREAVAAGQHALLVGGTMLYARCFQFGIADLPESDPSVRESLASRWQREGGEALYQELQDLDPEAASGLDANNRQRLLRALEVIHSTGRKISDLWRENAGQDASTRLGQAVHAVAVPEIQRGELHARIEQRFDQMLTTGFLDEVRALKARPELHLDLPSMRAVGYRQAWQHLAGELDESQFRADSLTATRRLAKRQLTWLRSWPELTRLPESPLEQQIARIASLLTAP